MSDSSDDYSSESEVEYEPIVVEDAEGKKTVIKEESNPLAPVVIISSKASEKSTKTKKIKVFATKDSMLSLIESVNSVQDGKIQAKLERDASYLQRLTNIEKATQERRSMKHERLDKIRDNLRKGGIRVKGENKRQVRKIKDAKEAAGEGRGRKPPHGGANKRSKTSDGPSKSRSGPSKSVSSRSSGPKRGGFNKDGPKGGQKSGISKSHGSSQKKVRFSV